MNDKQTKSVTFCIVGVVVLLALLAFASRSTFFGADEVAADAAKPTPAEVQPETP